MSDKKTSAQIAQENKGLLDSISSNWTQDERLKMIHGIATQLDKYIFESAVVDLTKDPTILNLNQMIAIITTEHEDGLLDLKERFEKYILSPSIGFFFID